MGLGALQPGHLIVVLVIVLLIFGPGKLPELGKAMGEGLRELKKATGGEHPDDATPRARPLTRLSEPLSAPRRTPISPSAPGACQLAPLPSCRDACRSATSSAAIAAQPSLAQRQTHADGLRPRRRQVVCGRLPGAHRRRRRQAATCQVLLVSSVVSVLVTRLYLEMTGYPRIGSGPLHVAHLLWGGLLMLAAWCCCCPSSASAPSAGRPLLGGLGFGLFVGPQSASSSPPITIYFFDSASDAPCYALFIVRFVHPRRASCLASAALVRCRQRTPSGPRRRACAPAAFCRQRTPAPAGGATCAPRTGWACAPSTDLPATGTGSSARSGSSSSRRRLSAWSRRRPRLGGGARLLPSQQQTTLVTALCARSAWCLLGVARLPARAAAYRWFDGRCLTPCSSPRSSCSGRTSSPRSAAWCGTWRC